MRVNSRTAPKQIAGLSGGVLDVCGNLSSITTPTAIGYTIQSTGSFNGALTYVVAHAFIAMICDVFVVGKIPRMVLKQCRCGARPMRTRPHQDERTRGYE